MFDLSQLPVPDVLAMPSYESLLAELVGTVKQLYPDYEPLESDDYMLLLQAWAYRELLLRQQMNN